MNDFKNLKELITQMDFEISELNRKEHDLQKKRRSLIEEQIVKYLKNTLPEDIHLTWLYGGDKKIYITFDLSGRFLEEHKDKTTQEVYEKIMKIPEINKFVLGFEKEGIYFINDFERTGLGGTTYASWTEDSETEI